MILSYLYFRLCCDIHTYYFRYGETNFLMLCCETMSHASRELLLCSKGAQHLAKPFVSSTSVGERVRGYYIA
jgi:hypothetical protein